MLIRFNVYLPVRPENPWENETFSVKLNQILKPGAKKKVYFGLLGFKIKYGYFTLI